MRSGLIIFFPLQPPQLIHLWGTQNSQNEDISPCCFYVQKKNLEFTKQIIIPNSMRSSSARLPNMEASPGIYHDKGEKKILCASTIRICIRDGHEFGHHEEGQHNPGF